MAIYVGERVMLTCAHVVAQALGDEAIRRQLGPPSKSITLHFFRTTNAKRSAKVRTNGWFRVLEKQEASLEADAGMSDIAVLHLEEELDEGTALPVSFTDVPPSRWEDALRFYGNTKSRPQGGWISARENGSVELDRIELRTGEGDQNIVEGGCSGSMVWDQIHGRCVGMVDARLSKRTAYMIPIDCLVAACTELHPEVPADQSLAIQIRRSIMLVNRKQERLQMETFLRELPRETPIKPTVCVISGHLKSHPDLLLNCFLSACFRAALGATQGCVSEAKEIEMIEEPQSMRRALAKIVCANPSDAHPGKVAEQMRNRKETIVITTELYLEDLNAQMEATLLDYIRFLEAIAKEGPNVPFFHCFCVTTNARELDAAQVRSINALFEDYLGLNAHNVHGPVCFGPLGKIQRRHLRDWINKELEPRFSADPRFDAKIMESHMLNAFPEEFDLNDCIVFVDEQLHRVLDHA
jgi:hypothetical protein